MLKCHRLVVFVLGFGFTATGSMGRPALVPEGEPRWVDVQVRNAGVAANEAGDLLVAYGKDGRLHLQTVAGPEAQAPWQLELEEEGFAPSILGLGLDNSRQAILHWLAESTFPGLPPAPELRVRRSAHAPPAQGPKIPPLTRAVRRDTVVRLGADG